VKCNEISPFTIPCPLRKKEALECPFYRSNNLEILIRRRVQIQILLAWWNIIILYYIMHGKYETVKVYTTSICEGGPQEVSMHAAVTVPPSWCDLFFSVDYHKFFVGTKGWGLSTQTIWREAVSTFGGLFECVKIERDGRKKNQC
jgi:hypothetical protein